MITMISIYIFLYYSTIKSSLRSHNMRIGETYIWAKHDITFTGICQSCFSKTRQDRKLRNFLSALVYVVWIDYTEVIQSFSCLLKNKFDVYSVFSWASRNLMLL